VAVTNDGSIYFVSGDYYPDVNIDTKPSFSSNSIIELIKKDLDTIQNLKIDNPELFIFPEGLNSEIKFRIVYVTTVRADKPLTALKYTIDANSGEVLSKDELINKISGTGKVYETNPTTPPLFLTTVSASLCAPRTAGYIRSMYQPGASGWSTVRMTARTGSRATTACH
jgi:Zn-dependent metalloprotease